MSSRNLSNISQSVHDRLLNQARQTGRPFNELLLSYGIERFLYRLAQTEHAGRFVLKGALLLRAEGAGPTRPTRDIDVLDLEVLDLEARKETVEEAVRPAIATGVPDDGMELRPRHNRHPRNPARREVPGPARHLPRAPRHGPRGDADRRRNGGCYRA
jgi:hypothetical protein